MVPEEIIAKILNPAPVEIQKKKKMPFAGFLPNFRSRLLVKIKRLKNALVAAYVGVYAP